MNGLEDFVLLISTTNQLTEQSFLDELFKFKNQIPNSDETIHSDLCLNSFKLDNKYYNADINFVTLKDQNQLNSNLIDQTEVLSIIFDLDQAQEISLKEVEKIYSKFNDDNLQEKILICRSNNKSLEVNNEQALNWCSKNRFELVDLSECKDPDYEDGSLKMLENIGLNRFVEILDTHSWKSIKFKDEQDNDLNQSNTSDLRSEIKQDNLVDSYFKELTLDENVKTLGDLDKQKLSFEELFSQIREFKDKADQLTGDDKYDYAEKVAMAFLNSLDDSLDED